MRYCLLYDLGAYMNNAGFLGIFSAKSSPAESSELLVLLYLE